MQRKGTPDIKRRLVFVVNGREFNDEARATRYRNKVEAYRLAKRFVAQRFEDGGLKCEVKFCMDFELWRREQEDQNPLVSLGDEYLFPNVE